MFALRYMARVELSCDISYVFRLLESAKAELRDGSRMP